jgi:hypothetical protein
MSPAEPLDLDSALTDLRRATDELAAASRAVESACVAYGAALGTADRAEAERALRRVQALAIGAMTRLGLAQKTEATARAHTPETWGRP